MKKYSICAFFFLGNLLTLIHPAFATKWYITDQEHPKLYMIESSSNQKKEIPLPGRPKHLTTLNNTVYVSYAYKDYISKITDDKKEKEDIKIGGVPGRLITYKGKVFCAQEQGINEENAITEIDSQNSTRKIFCESPYLPIFFTTSSKGLFIGAKNKTVGEQGGAIFKLEEPSPSLTKIRITCGTPNMLAVVGERIYSYERNVFREYIFPSFPKTELEDDTPQRSPRILPQYLSNYQDKLFFILNKNNMGIIAEAKSTPNYYPLNITRKWGCTAYGNQIILGAETNNKYELLTIEEVSEGEEKKMTIIDRKEISIRPNAIVALPTNN